MEKHKIKITQEKETLLVPLLAKAMKNPILSDSKAESILKQIDYNFQELKTPRQTMITLAMRAKQLDQYVRDYLATAENPVIIHLGCGLDARVERVHAQNCQWYDLDFPEVIELRKQFFKETESYKMLASSVTDFTWLDSIQSDGPACIIAEGLFMYLQESDIKELFQQLHHRFSGSTLCFDAYGLLTAKYANKHPSIKKTGALIQWGIDNPELIEEWGDGYKFLEEWYFTDSQDIPLLKAYERFMFRFMSHFKSAKKAHRIVRVTV